MSPVQDGARPGREEDGQVREQPHEAHGQQGAALSRIILQLSIKHFIQFQ